MELNMNRKRKQDHVEAAAEIDLTSQRSDSPTDDKSIKTLPRRFRTAFILFSSSRHKEIRDRLGSQGKNAKTANIAKIVSNEWRTMPPDEKQEWNLKAKSDKDRFDAEMTKYKVMSDGTEAQIPKRPMSAFLAFSNQRRAALKRAYPDSTNADLSKMLSKAWKEAPPEVKAEYIEHEASLRAQYNIDMMPWRNKQPRKTVKVVRRESSPKSKKIAVEASTKTCEDSDLLPPPAESEQQQEQQQVACNRESLSKQQQQQLLQHSTLLVASEQPSYRESLISKQQQLQQRMQESESDLLASYGNSSYGTVVGFPSQATVDSYERTVHLPLSSNGYHMLNGPTHQGASYLDAVSDGGFYSPYGSLMSNSTAVSNQQLLQRYRDSFQPAETVSSTHLLDQLRRERAISQRQEEFLLEQALTMRQGRPSSSGSSMPTIMYPSMMGNTLNLQGQLMPILIQQRPSDGSSSGNIYSSGGGVYYVEDPSVRMMRQDHATYYENP